MKNYIILQQIKRSCSLLLLLLLAPLFLFSQTQMVSELKIDSIHFIVNKKDTLNYSLIEKKAIPLKAVTTMEVHFFMNKELLKKNNSESLIFNVQLYQKSATRWLPYYYKNIKLERKENPNENVLIYKRVIPTGLWQIVLYSISEKGPVKYKDKEDIVFLIE